MYITFQQFDPKLDLGFDMSKKYQAALGMFRRKKSQQVPLDEQVSHDSSLTESRNFAMPDRLLQQRETAGRVWQALDGLPFDQRTAIVLREINGLSYEEIAESLGVAVGTVKSRLARARTTLRSTLERT